MGQKMGGLLLGIAGVWASLFGLSVLFAERQVRSYVHPSHFLDDLKFVAALAPPLAADESRGALTLARAPRASLRVVP